MAEIHQKPSNPRFQDLTGRTFGRLTVVAYAGKRNGMRQWLCRCECNCGKDKAYFAVNLLRGKSKSCGCLNAEVSGARRRTHGMTRTTTYVAWHAMWQRCTDATRKDYSRYGGRGINVCSRWERFEAFLSDMGERPSPSHSIDRINNSGDYEPGNCRWATIIQQARNKRNNRLITHDGRTATVAEWAEITGICRSTINSRLRDGWEPATAVSTPLLS